VLSTTPTANPSQEIIGPGPYTNANGSIAGNGAHNPFLNQTATFTIGNSSITANTVVSNVIFSFGTTAGVNVPGVGVVVRGDTVPEPANALLIASGISLIVALRRKYGKRVRA
jgi:hypothetical protein